MLFLSAAGFSSSAPPMAALLPAAAAGCSVCYAAQDDDRLEMMSMVALRCWIAVGCSAAAVA